MLLLHVIVSIIFWATFPSHHIIILILYVIHRMSQFTHIHSLHINTFTVACFSHSVTQ